MPPPFHPRIFRSAAWAQAFAWVLGLALGLELGGPAEAADNHRTTARDYQRLDEWAREHDFTVTRTAGSRDVVVAGGGTRIEMQIDSTRIEVNKVGVWLSHPVLAAEQQVFVSGQDLRGVLEALFSPRKLAPGKRLKVVCLDPGHGGKDPGHRSGTRNEKQYTLLLADEVRERLVKAGFAVIMTRRDDSYPELPERTDFARKHGADLFVSLHFNAAPDGSSDVSGIEVYAMAPEGTKPTNISNEIGSLRAWAGNEHDPENLHLAFQIQKSILKNVPGAEDRGVRRARFVVLRLAEMPAVVVEGGFMSNPSDARWIFSQTGRDKLGQAIADGIINYRRLVERPAQVPSLATTPGRGPPSKPAAAATSEADSRRMTPPASQIPAIRLPPQRVPAAKSGATNLASEGEKRRPAAEPAATPPVISLPPQRAVVPKEPSTNQVPEIEVPARPAKTEEPDGPVPVIELPTPPQRSTSSKSSSTNAAPDSPKN